MSVWSMSRSTSSKSRTKPPFRKGGKPGGSSYAKNPDTALDEVFLYGLHAAEAALENSERTILSASITQNVLPSFEALFAERQMSPEVLHPKDLARKAPEGAVHQGILLRAKPLPAVDLEELTYSGPYVFLDRITDPHNIGAIFRTAAAFNATAIVTTKRFTPEATGLLAKVASGGIEYVPWARETNLSRAIDSVRSTGVTVIGFDSEAESTISDIVIDRPVALVLGAEDKGLRQKTRDYCDVLARLDMPGAIKSLNVSNAAAIGLYHLSQKSA